MDGTEYMLVREKVIEAQVFGCTSKTPNGVGIATKLDLWVCNANLHGP